MVSTTSGLSVFNLDVDDIIEQALEPLGGDYTDAVEQQKARRALNLILIELQNKNVPLHKIATTSVPLIIATQEYTLSGSVSDVLEATLKTTSTSVETTLERYGSREWHQIPDKTTTNQPTLFSVDRNSDAVTVKLWPIPDTSSKWTLELLTINKIEDINAAYQKVDLPYRYLPLLVAWLSYKLSMTRQGVGEDVKNRLKFELDLIMQDTFEEDRERTDFYIVPGGISGR